MRLLIKSGSRITTLISSICKVWVCLYDLSELKFEYLEWNIYVIGCTMKNLMLFGGPVVEIQKGVGEEDT